MNETPSVCRRDSALPAQETAAGTGRREPLAFPDRLEHPRSPADLHPLRWSDRGRPGRLDLENDSYLGPGYAQREIDQRLRNCVRQREYQNPDLPLDYKHAFELD